MTLAQLRQRLPDIEIPDDPYTIGYWLAYLGQPEPHPGHFAGRGIYEAGCGWKQGRREQRQPTDAGQREGGGEVGL